MNLWSTLPTTAPAPGDIVTRAATFAPLSVRSQRTDSHAQLWLSLSDGTEERVECLKWFPRVGDKVTVNLATFAAGLKAAMVAAPENSAEMLTLKKLSNALTSPSSWVYHNHTLQRINDSRATILDSKGATRSLGIASLVVVERATGAAAGRQQQLSLL